jgi:ABC-2 type transport system permease protein
MVPLKTVLKVPFRGNALLFGVISLVAIVFNIGIGLVIAGFARRMSQVGLLTVLFLAPMLFLSGGWVPPESMPSWLRPITNFSPLKYYLELGLGVILKGLTLRECFVPMLSFLLLSVLCLAGGYTVLVRRLSLE